MSFFYVEIWCVGCAKRPNHSKRSEYWSDKMFLIQAHAYEPRVPVHATVWSLRHITLTLPYPAWTTFYEFCSCAFLGKSILVHHLNNHTNYFQNKCIDVAWIRKFKNSIFIGVSVSLLAYQQTHTKCNKQSHLLPYFENSYSCRVAMMRDWHALIRSEPINEATYKHSNKEPNVWKAHSIPQYLNIRWSLIKKKIFSQNVY